MDQTEVDEKRQARASKRAGKTAWNTNRNVSGHRSNSRHSLQTQERCEGLTGRVSEHGVQKHSGLGRLGLAWCIMHVERPAATKRWRWFAGRSSGYGTCHGRHISLGPGRGGNQAGMPQESPDKELIDQLVYHRRCRQDCNAVNTCTGCLCCVRAKRYRTGRSSRGIRMGSVPKSRDFDTRATS